MAKTGPGAIKAGEAYVEIGTDLRPLDKGLAQVSTKLKKLSTQMRGIGIGLTAAGVALAAPLVAAVKTFTGFGDQVAKMARRTGFSTEAISELGFAAQITGADIGGLETGVRRMARAVIDAQDGMVEYQRAFERVGLNVEELRGLSPEAVFLRIGEAIASVTDPMLRAAAAQEIFGRSGTMLLPLFQQGADGIAKLRARAIELGRSLGPELAGLAELLADTIQELRDGMLALAIAIGGSLGPAVVKVTGGITNTIVRIVAWTKANPQLVRTITHMAGAIAVLALGLGALALAIWGVTAALAVFTAHPIVLAITGIAALTIATAGYIGLTELMADAAGDAGDAVMEMADAQKAAADKGTEATRRQLEDLAKLSEAFDEVASSVTKLGAADIGFGGQANPTFFSILEQGPERVIARTQFEIESLKGQILELGRVQADWTDEVTRTGRGLRNLGINAEEMARLIERLQFAQQELGAAQELLADEVKRTAPQLRTGMRVAAGGFGGVGQLAGRGAFEVEIKQQDLLTQQVNILKSIDGKLGPGNLIPFQGALTPASP